MTAVDGVETSRLKGDVFDSWPYLIEQGLSAKYHDRIVRDAMTEYEKISLNV